MIDRGQPAPSDPAASDDDLARRAAAGDPDALADLLERFRPRVWSVCRRMVGPELADDLAHDSLVRAIQGIPSFKGESAFSTWIIRVAMNTCLSYRRRQARRDRLAPTDRSRSIDDAEPAELPWNPRGPHGVQPDIEGAESLERVDRALRRIDETHRAVLVLRDVQGLEYAQIAEVLGVKRGTVKSRLFRAREALRSALHQGGPPAPQPPKDAD